MEIFHWSILLFFKKTSSHIFSNSFFLSGGSDPYLLPAHVIFSIDCFRQGLKLQKLSLTLCTGELRPLTTKSSSPRSQLQKTGGMTMLHLRKQFGYSSDLLCLSLPGFLSIVLFFYRWQTAPTAVVSRAWDLTSSGCASSSWETASWASPPLLSGSSSAGWLNMYITFWTSFLIADKSIWMKVK